MSRPIGCEHGLGTVASDALPILDFGWWASKGPTAGYLMRLAADATTERCPAHGIAGGSDPGSGTRWRPAVNGRVGR
jgi:hypothetical protein